MEFLTTLGGFMTSGLIGQVLSLIILFAIIGGLYRMHKSKDCTFNITDLLVGRDGKIEGSKFRMNLAFGITSWVLIYSSLHGTLTEWLFAGYLAAWVADRKFSRDIKSITPIDTGTNS